MPIKKRVTYCKCCGQKIVDYKQIMGKVLLDDLLLLQHYGAPAKVSELSRVYQMDMTHANNFQKLIYFGLVDKSENRYWVSAKGEQFLAGTGNCPAYVYTRQGIVVKEGPGIYIQNVKHAIQSYEYFTKHAVFSS